jgi:hypothetical protein
MYSVKDYGAVGDGVADDTLAVQAAYDAAVQAGGGTLLFPTGRYRCNLSMYSRSVDIRGEGRIASKLHAADTTKSILNAVFREGSWNAVTIADLELSNPPGNIGVGLGYGSDPYVRYDEFSGIVNVERVGFNHLDRCIYRRQGQIGLWLTNCNFAVANYHVFVVGQAATTDHELMHGGCLFVKHSHFDGAQLASLYVHSPIVGTGQWSIEDCIFEANPGFVLFADGFADNDRVPALNFVRCWNEVNATATSVVVEGQSYQPAFARLAACERAIFEDTPVGQIVLRDNSNLLLSRCDIGGLGAVDRDPSCSVTIEDAYLYSGEVKEVCRSFQVTGKLPPAAGGGTWWPRIPLSALSHAFGIDTVLKNDASASIEFSGSTTRMTVTGSGPSSPPTHHVQELSINVGETLLPIPQANLVPGNWYVAKYIYRHQAGQPIKMQFTGNSGDTDQVTLDSASWRTLVCIFKAGAAGGANSFYHFGPSTGTTVIEIGGYSLTRFSNRNDALIHGNDSTLAV